jgi:transmembrane sensor
MADEHAQRTDLDADWESVARYLAGACAPDEARRMLEQLERNPERGALVAALDAALVMPDEQPLSATEVERALAAVRARVASEAADPSHDGVVPIRERPTARLARIRWKWQHAGIRAAAAVLVVAGASMLWRATRSSELASVASTPSAPSFTHYSSAVGKLDSIRLADGSRVMLGPDSRLDVPNGFGDTTRAVLLTGDAYFDVVHDARVPFVVRTKSATVRDVGTTFSVRSDADGGTRVAVTTGAVDLTAAHPGAGTSVVLRAGDRAVAGANGVRVERGGVSSEDLSWTHGVLVFRDAPLADVTVGLRRWFGIELVVTDSVIAGRRLTATFDRGNPDEVGGVLAAALGGSVTRSGDTLRIGAARSARD